MTIRIGAPRALTAPAGVIATGVTGSAVLALLALVLVVPASHAKPELTLKSTSVEFPAGTEGFPDGPGVDTVRNNCTACHSPGMILNQPPMSKTVWETEVKKMMSVFKAPVDPKDVDTIVGYLVATKGPK